MPPATARGEPRTGLALLAVCLAALAMPLTFTGTAVALPAIGRDLGGGATALAWATNAFMLTFGSCLMLAGALADATGRKRVFLAGSGAFAASSLALVLAPTILVFDLLRAGQGLAAAAAFSGGMAALAQEIPPARRLRAFSLVGTSFGVGLSLGPVASGAIVAVLGWRGIFVPVAAFAAAAALLGRGVLRESRDPQAGGVDGPGAASFTAALACLTTGFLLAPERGFGDAAVIGLLAAAGLLALAFVAVETRRDRPMLDLSLFRYPRFVGVQLLAASPAYGFVVLLILLPLRFVGVEGRGEVPAGLLMIALSGPLLGLPLLAGQLTRWMRPAVLCGAGLLISAGGLLWLALTPPDAPVALVALPMVAIGAGIGLPWGLMDGLAVSVVPKERAGMAAGLFSTVRVAGEGIALAVVGAALAALVAARLHPAGPGAAAAAHRLAVGDLAQAAGLLPGLGREALRAAYAEAFGTLLRALAGITLATAALVFVLLGRTGEETSGEAPRDEPAGGLSHARE